MRPEIAMLREPAQLLVAGSFLSDFQTVPRVAGVQFGPGDPALVCVRTPCD